MRRWKDRETWGGGGRECQRGSEAECFNDTSAKQEGEGRQATEGWGTDRRENALEQLGHGWQASVQRDQAFVACRLAFIGDDVERRFAVLGWVACATCAARQHDAHRTMSAE